MIKKIILLFTSFIIATACSNTEEVVFQTGTINILASGPLFEGSNTGTFDWNLIMEDYIAGISGAEDIKEARLQSVVLKSTHMNLISDLTLQMAGENTGMQKLAYMDGEGKIQVANKQKNLASFFSDNHRTIVADFNINDDWYDDFAIEAELIFTLQVSTKNN
jgi:hypothetical protein